MASRLWRKSLTSMATAAARVTQPAVQKTIIPLDQSIAAGPSPTVFRRMYSIHQHFYPQMPQLQLEQHDEYLKLERGLDEKQLKNGKEMEDKGPKSDIKKFTELFCTSQKILIGCDRNFKFAHDMALSLGDARNFVIMSEKSFGEMMRSCENARYHMHNLLELGANFVFDVDFHNYEADCRINHTVYDHVIVDMCEKFMGKEN